MSSERSGASGAGWLENMALRRLYLDTNVFVESLQHPRSASARLVRLAAGGHFVVVESDYLLEEAQDVFSRLFGATMAAFELKQMRTFAEATEVSARNWRPRMANVDPFIRDRADAPHFAAAVAGGAQVLVSRNRRSILPGMFDVVPLALPEDVVPALLGESPWPSSGALRERWERWARRSPRSP